MLGFSEEMLESLSGEAKNTACRRTESMSRTKAESEFQKVHSRDNKLITFINGIIVGFPFSPESDEMTTVNHPMGSTDVGNISRFRGGTLFYSRFWSRILGFL